MSEHFPSGGIQLVLPSVGHVGSGIVVQQDDVTDFP
jgi:hypothetical protein